MAKQKDGLNAQQRFNLKRPPILVRVSLENKAALRILARKDKLSVSRYCENVLDSHLIKMGAIRINRILTIQ